ncbi:MAG: glycosyltransferase family 2 protein [Brevinematales bacterium]|jgi:dolichol-phosphate mannosyltransferase
MNKTFKLSVIVPVYNEEKNIPVLLERLKKVIDTIGCGYEIIFSMDPCKDRTGELILEARKKDNNIKLIRMSRRFGQPASTIAGIHYCTGDACVVIDADLQDPPELIKDMVEKWKEGYHVVYAQRKSRKGETFIKRIVAFLGYKIINRISDVNIPRNTGDFRLMSREVIDNLKLLKENDAFLRGLVGYIGFNQIGIQYERDSRLSGKGKYNRFFGSLKIGLNGILSFSKYPLDLISISGVIIACLSFLLGIFYIVFSLMHIRIPWGNPTLVILISFYSGIQLLSLGIIGQYLARMFDEVKGRPVFIVQEAHGFEIKNINK